MPVWRVSWSLAGNLLAIAAADNSVTVYEEKVEGAWEKISQVNDNVLNNEYEESKDQ